jgi:hypothetical protein
MNDDEFILINLKGNGTATATQQQQQQSMPRGIGQHVHSDG